MSHVRLRGRSDGDVSLTPNEVTREWRLGGRVLECCAVLGSFNKATGETLTRRQPVARGVSCLLGTVQNSVTLQCPVIGHEQLVGSTATEALGQFDSLLEFCY